MPRTVAIDHTGMFINGVRVPVSDEATDDYEVPISCIQLLFFEFHVVLVTLLITHAGCIAAGWVGHTVASVCLSVCPHFKGKRLELSTPNLVHVYSIAVAPHAQSQTSKDQSQTVCKN